MSVLNLVRPCPCRSSRCRTICAARILGAVIALALIAAQLLIVTGAIHDPVNAAGRPAPASTTAMLEPALQAGSQLRPTWNGERPARWTGLDPMCPASSARLHRWARTGPGAPWFRVECLPDGPRQWAWNAITRR